MQAERIEQILNGPDRIMCKPLRANLSLRQCALNQAQARLDRFGPLCHCLHCQDPYRAKEKLKPKKRITGGYSFESKALKQAIHNGEVEIPKEHRSVKTEIRDLRDRSVKAGWSTKKIDYWIAETNRAGINDIGLIIKAWRKALNNPLPDQGG